MWMKAEQLPATLTRGLAPIYLLSGDEPLQLGEAADAVRQAAYKAGYENRKILTVDAKFSWVDFLQEIDSISIFSDKKIIDLRLPTGKPGMEGSKALIRYCERLPEDTLLLISAGKLDKSAKKSKWVTTLEKQGVALQVWPLDGTDLVQWIQQRMQRRGLSTDKQGLGVIALRVEGNLLAAHQEIEKLYVLYGQGVLTVEQITQVVADASRYDVFNLVNAALTGRVDRINKTLTGIQQEGIAAPIVLWALAREIRSLISIQQQLDAGQPRNSVFMRHQVWDKRQKLVSHALSKLTRQDLMGALLIAVKTDRQIKGEQEGDCWESLLEISLMLAGN
ncbi:DNA polymerase III subunit delta [Bathymodiolus platifrons methanotrophic gill symbiont]|nr:DNA polymerase III subunit delta [Bathymodiolus platifrons methanotrophic gill symbiont]